MIEKTKITKTETTEQVNDIIISLYNQGNHIIDIPVNSIYEDEIMIVYNVNTSYINTYDMRIAEITYYPNEDEYYISDKNYEDVGINRAVREISSNDIKIVTKH